MIRPGPLRVALLGALAAAALVLAGPAQAQAVDTSRKQALERNIQQAQQQLQARQQQVQQITKELGDTASQLQAKVRQRDAVNKQLGDLRAQQAQLQDQLTALQDQRSRTEARIKDLNDQLDSVKEQVRAMIVTLYQQRMATVANTLARSRTLHEFQVNNYYLSLLAKQDVDLINRLSTLVGQLKQAQDQLAGEMEALKAKQAALAQNASDQEQKRKQLQAVINDLEQTKQGQLAQKQAVLQEQNQIEADLQGLNKQLDSEVARLKQQEAAARAAAASYAADRNKQLQYQHQADEARAKLDALTAPAQPLPTGFVLPLEKGKIVSRFGEGNNSYIAIQAAVPNAAVRSVQDGKVVAISYLGANFGYMVAVQHGGGLTTVYTNLRKPVVTLYDAVKQGQVLGYLGGGTLSNDILPFYARTDTGGKSAFIDPAPLFGK
ncbi:MAG TPA: peptidoglycan DD-metalloendopeptidase family protein [Trueperaceae bacterium]|nr:peptidoglycan DD-metalloendopeptidase family protein [Trueperaceae bacterium]